MDQSHSDKVSSQLGGLVHVNRVTHRTGEPAVVFAQSSANIKGRPFVKLDAVVLDSCLTGGDYRPGFSLWRIALVTGAYSGWVGHGGFTFQAFLIDVDVEVPDPP
jgi:hypothetical protein